MSSSRLGLLASLLALFALIGCAETGHFESTYDESLAEPEVVVHNDSDRDVYVTFTGDPEASSQLDAPTKSEGKLRLVPGTYDYQLFVSSKAPFEKRWSAHGPKGKAELEARHRYSWTWNPE